MSQLKHMISQVLQDVQDHTPSDLQEYNYDRYSYEDAKLHAYMKAIEQACYRDTRFMSGPFKEFMMKLEDTLLNMDLYKTKADTDSSFRLDDRGGKITIQDANNKKLFAVSYK